MSKQDVFINAPFDRRYERLFVAVITALTAHGFRPRSLLELPATAVRPDRLLAVIRERASIHDLSRVTRSGPDRVPRFNMPFELGLAVAVARAKRHDWFVFEARPFRLQTSLSDLNGFDPLIHEDDPVGVLRAVSNAFSSRDRNVRLPALVLAFEAMQKISRKLEKTHGTLYARSAFAALVAAAQGVGRSCFEANRR